MELIIVAIIALVIFGPKRVPELGRSIGHGIREFKGSISGDDKDEGGDEVHRLEAAKTSPDEAKPEAERELAVARQR
ncbi:MAG: Sec-independent protein translocase subunit TatA/TatB [Candidatus Limnocylindria bacterium]